MSTGLALHETIAPGVTVLRGYAAPTRPLYEAVLDIASASPFRRLTTSWGKQMSVAMTNCGPWGWFSDRKGYRYVEVDPVTGRPWPRMPQRFMELARSAAEAGGFPDFEPDACLVNRYAVGSQMGAHRDYDELDMRFPIVSVSIGLPATFYWYGPARSGPALRVPLEDGDVVVWGGKARPGYHGVRKVAEGAHPMTGAFRYNLTFRRAK